LLEFAPRSVTVAEACIVGLLSRAMVQEYVTPGEGDICRLCTSR
jgi:hypothetical protein